ncbi:MAG: DUF1592 domain-containing protein, partial [Myxococcota bacterium]|nr:DUF1592 domain-containing protein [Myxococcota bacterium]
CAQEPEQVVDGMTLMSPRAQLIRASVDLRGVHPSETELQAIASNPELYEGFVDRYLADPRFLDRAVELWNQRLLTSTGGTYGQSYPNASGRDISAAMSGETLQLVRHIVEQDLPYGEIVLADYTMANPLLAGMWELDRSGDEGGWAPAQYTDGREHAGILTMSSVWLRYPSAGGNANRHRANAVSKMLLCDDYLSRPIVLNRAAVDQLTVDPETAISTNATCQSCHSTLDPLSAHFFGWFEYDDEMSDPTLYKPENEKAWMEYAGRSPAYYGVPTASIREMAELIAEDPRFIDCAVQTAWEGLNQRSLADGDWSDFQAHRDAFLESGRSIRSVVRSVVLSPAYRAKAADDPELDARLATVRTVSPSQLHTVIEDITGYSWEFGGRPGLESHGMGLPVLLGGIDGDTVTNRSYEPGVGTVFIQERLAQSAGWHVARHDLDPDREADALMLRYVTAEDTPTANERAFETQIRALYLQATGYPLADQAAEVHNLITLWRQLHSVEGSSEAAWAGVISAVLRDPLVLTY